MTNRTDRLTLLETFVRIAERGSLSQAARDLGTSQPSVSRQLSALEARVGVVLVRRTTHDVALTADGIELLADARRMLGTWQALEERHSGTEDLTGVIRVVAPVALGQGLLVRAAADFLKMHPKVSVDWRLRDDVIRFAEEGCDCWVKVGAIPDDTLLVRELSRVERLVVGTPECLAHHRGTALQDMPWLTLGPFEGNRIELRNKAGHLTEFSVTPKLATDSIMAIYEAVRLGLGVAILPRWFVSGDLKAARLVDAATGLRAASLPVNLALAPGIRRSARVEQFSEILQDRMSKEIDFHQ